MKFNLQLLALTFFLAFSSCTNEDDSNKPNPNTGGDNNQPIVYAMTAKINGAPYNMFNSLKTNTSTSTLFDYYPSTEFIRLQGCVEGPASGKEINIWIKRTDLVVGTYDVGQEVLDGSKSFIGYRDNTNAENEKTVAGKIYISSIDLQSKIVKGSFNFTTSNDPTQSTPIINYTFTGGIFNYRYDID